MVLALKDSSNERKYILHYTKLRAIGRWKNQFWYHQSLSQIINIYKQFPFWLFIIVFKHVKEKNEPIVDYGNLFSTVFEFNTSVQRSILNSSYFLFYAFFFRAFATETICTETKFQLRLLDWTLHIVNIFKRIFLKPLPCL